MARQVSDLALLDGEQVIPRGTDSISVRVGRRSVELTHLDKPFWPELEFTKGDLLRFYAAVSPYLLPHITDRAMVLKRYPNGAHDDFFFMKRAPSPRPEWIETCRIEHASGNVIDFPVVQDLLSLLWVVNLGCIDLNPWYSRCDDINRPDFLHFDLDPSPGAGFAEASEVALLVRDALEALRLPCYAKTSGSRGIHIYVPIVRGPLQKEVWTVAKELAFEWAAHYPKLVTAEYRKANRPAKRILVDYNQNAWGRTLASIYSVRPKNGIPVSTPVTFEEIERGVAIEDFTVFTLPDRLRAIGDLWKPLNAARGRANLTRLVTSMAKGAGKAA